MKIIWSIMLATAALETTPQEQVSGAPECNEAEGGLQVPDEVAGDVVCALPPVELLPHGVHHR